MHPWQAAFLQLEQLFVNKSFLEMGVKLAAKTGDILGFIGVGRFQPRAGEAFANGLGGLDQGWQAILGR